MSGPRVCLQDLSRLAVERHARDGAVVVVPCGSTEQHGIHLPTGVDARIAEAIAVAAAEQVAGQMAALVAPVLSLGYSGEHLDFGATISLRPETLLRVHADVIDCLARSGFRRIFFLNGHGGNEELIAVAEREARFARPELLLTGSSYWRLAAEALAALQEEPSPGIAHGGEIETSLMLYLAPDLVDQAAAAPNRAPWGSPYLKGGLITSAPVFYGRRRSDLTRAGHTGDPTLASRAKGEKMFGAVVQAVAAFLLDFARWPFPSA